MSHQQQQQQTTQRPGPRLHRLPRRLDYTLVPAPLDLSLDTMTEKSPLPAIIVTPSSPTHSKDFAIAFLAPPRQPSVFARAWTGLKARVGGAVDWTKSRAGYASPPIALPISAPATMTEFNHANISGKGMWRWTRGAKRGGYGRVVMMVFLVAFFLVFCHMLAHLLAYASMERSLVASAANVGGEGSKEGVVVMHTGLRGAAAGNLLGKLEIQKWLEWVSGSSSAVKEGAVTVV